MRSLLSALEMYQMSYIATITTLDKSIFDMSLKVNKWLYNPKITSEVIVSTCEAKGIRLPKLGVPTFDSDILQWQTFWEQFCVAILGYSEACVFAAVSEGWICKECH